MTGFEYKTLSIDSKETEHSEKALSDKLNRYGKDGWELVTCFSYPCIGSSGYDLSPPAQTPKTKGFYPVLSFTRFF